MIDAENRDGDILSDDRIVEISARPELTLPGAPSPNTGRPCGFRRRSNASGCSGPADIAGVDVARDAPEACRISRPDFNFRCWILPANFLAHHKTVIAVDTYRGPPRCRHMQVQVSGKQVDVGEALGSRITLELQDGVGKYFERGGSKAEVVVSKDGFGFKVDCWVRLASGEVIVTSGQGGDAQMAFTDSLEKLEKRVRRYKRRLKNHHAGPPGAVAREVRKRRPRSSVDDGVQGPGLGRGRGVRRFRARLTSRRRSAWSSPKPRPRSAR